MGALYFEVVTVRRLQASALGPRILGAMLAVALNIALLELLLTAGFLRPSSATQGAISARLIETENEPLLAPILTVPVLMEPEIVLTSVVDPVPIAFEVNADAPINAAPMLATEVPSELLKELSQRAGLAQDEQVTVLVRIEVLPSGVAGAVTVEIPRDREAVIAAAIAYVRRLVWVPGYRAGEPTPTVIRMAVHLAG